MGFFSWMFCDRRNQRPLRVGNRAYVPFPKDQGACGLPGGTVLIENCYDGYGHFQGYDIYDLVADWNRDTITSDNITKPERGQWSPGKEWDPYYRAAMDRYEMSVCRLNDFQEGKDVSYMVDKYGKDWKREIGIDIACHDEQNAGLKYPIKICYFRKSKYEDLPASESDPDQGWF